MTQATTYPFSKFLLKAGDGGSPEVFTDLLRPDVARDSPALLISTTPMFRTATIQTRRPGSAVTWCHIRHRLRGLAWWRRRVSRHGKTGGTPGETRNVQIEIGTPPEFAWIAASPSSQEFAITANRGNKVEMTIAIVSDGAVVPMDIP